MRLNSTQMKDNIWANNVKKEENLAAEDKHQHSPPHAEEDRIKDLPVLKKCTKSKTNYSELTPIVWRNVIIMALLHVGFLHGFILAFYCDFRTILVGAAFYCMSGFGITVGAHRLWSHKQFKARIPLRILLMLFQTISFQGSIYQWCRDHRAHHKWADTDGDPHNASRGFFFSHIGWLLVKKHPDVIKKGARLPLDDLLQDPVVYYQKMFYYPMAVFLTLGLPTFLPWYFWNENPYTAFLVAGVARYVLSLHVTFTINSVAHLWGNRPYDKYIQPRQNLFVSIVGYGEGFHNYHHTFPQDYAQSEWGARYFNIAKGFIDIAAMLGLAYDRVKISPEVVLARRKRTGDISHNHHHHHHGHSHGSLHDESDHDHDDEQAEKDGEVEVRYADGYDWEHDEYMKILDE